MLPDPSTRSSNTLIFAPTFNERCSIESLVDQLLGLRSRCDILIVDDGSGDGTAEFLTDRIASEPRLRVIFRPGKLGIGSAHILAWTYARQAGYARIVTMDADLSHDPADVQRVLDLLDSGVDVAIGSRFAPGGRLDYRGWRLFLSRSGNRTASLLLRFPITEYTTSLRAARLDRVPEGLIENISADGYTFFLTSIVLLARAGLVIREIPIHFRDRFGGKSKVSRGEIFRGMYNLLRLGLEQRILYRNRNLAKR